MADAKLSSDVYKNANGAWHQYLKDLSPLRPALYQYCRALTGSTWDADDLVQEALMRGFATLGVGQDEIKDPRAYLLRIAANAWIDWRRRKAVEATALTEMASEAISHPDAGHTDELSVRDAGSVLIQELAPQERVAVVLKDVFDLSLDEMRADSRLLDRRDQSRAASWALAPRIRAIDPRETTSCAEPLAARSLRATLQRERHRGIGRADAR